VMKSCTEKILSSNRKQKNLPPKENGRDLRHKLLS
jgi:hypothetical protein